MLWSFAVAFLIGVALHWTLKRLEAKSSRPDGFGQGVVQGALMPLTLPNLLAGDDVSIYSPENTGRTYKLGYITGVNSCGLIFFGFLFWRFSRLRKEFRRAQ